MKRIVTIVTVVALLVAIPCGAMAKGKSKGGKKGATHTTQGVK